MSIWRIAPTGGLCLRDDDVKSRRLVFGLFVGFLILAGSNCRRSPQARRTASERHPDNVRERPVETSDTRSKQPSIRPNDGGYNSDGLPPKIATTTYVADYYRGEGGWGPAPALSITCRKCGYRYSEQSRLGTDRVPDIEKAKVRMRKTCPNGENNCLV